MREGPKSQDKPPANSGTQRRWKATTRDNGSGPVLLNLDNLDREIVRLLQADGRITTAQMARELSVSEPTIRKRLDRLLVQEIIKVTAVINPHKTGFGMDMIFGIHVKPGFTADVAEQFAAFDQVTYVGQTIGRFDIFVNMLFRNEDDFRQFLNERIQTINGIDSYETLHVLYVERLDFDWTAATKLPENSGVALV